jgi:hypothetical protein
MEPMLGLEPEPLTAEAVRGLLPTFRALRSGDIDLTSRCSLSRPVATPQVNLPTSQTSCAVAERSQLRRIRGRPCNRFASRRGVTEKNFPSGTANYTANVPPTRLSVSWADVRPIGSRSLSLEMMEWKRQYESNSRGVRNRSAVKAWAQHFDRKRRDLQAKLTFYAQYREGRLIHKNLRTKLWTSGNFLSGSSALPIGYFSFNFLQTFRRSLAATPPAPRRTRSGIPTASRSDPAC